MMPVRLLLLAAPFAMSLQLMARSSPAQARCAQPIMQFQVPELPTLPELPDLPTPVADALDNFLTSENKARGSVMKFDKEGRLVSNKGKTRAQMTAERKEFTRWEHQSTWASADHCESSMEGALK